MKNLQRIILGDISSDLLFNFIIGYILMRLNSVVAIISPHLIYLPVMIGSQVLLGGLVYLFARRINWSSMVKSNDWDGQDLLAIVLLIISMFASCMAINALGVTESTNQANVLALMNYISLPVFACYLILASVIEELIFRGLLFGLTDIVWVDVLLTSGLFSWLHSPDNLSVGLVYFVLGCHLAAIRQKFGLQTAIIVHVVWNIVVLFIQLLK